MKGQVEPAGKQSKYHRMIRESTKNNAFEVVLSQMKMRRELRKADVKAS